MIAFLLNHWLALLLIGLVVAVIIGFAYLSLIAAVWRKSDEIDERFD